VGSANLELVRSIYAAWERGDFSSADWAAPNFEFVISGRQRGPADGHWKGLAEASKGLGDYLDAWDNLRPEVEEYRELDTERVFVLSHSSFFTSNAAR
jgi:ketosteroid isomerase-like protein